MLDYEQIGDRLRSARDMAGMSQQEAASFLGITSAALSQYEKGKRRIEALYLERLSHFYGVPLGYFFGRSTPKSDWEEALRSVSRVSPANSKKGVSYLIAQVKVLEKLYLITETPLPKVPHPPFAAIGEEHFADYEVEEYADRARHYFNLGTAPIHDLKIFLESLGYHIFAVPFGSDNTELSGLFFTHPTLGPIIAFNENQSLGRAVYTMAHELAHNLYHYDRPTILCRSKDTREIESFAERFASYFLISGEALKMRMKSMQIKTVSTASELVHLSRYFGVSYRAVKQRLNRENHLRLEGDLDNVQPVRLAKSLGYKPTPYEYGIRPLPLDMRFPGISLELISHAIAQDRISPSYAAGMLGISDIELEDLFSTIETEESDTAQDVYA
jgi:Zn-dependent peptidase ImmA (M78 family)/transcriptional regulator with XRE-family HTH domain